MLHRTTRKSGHVTKAVIFKKFYSTLTRNMYRIAYIDAHDCFLVHGYKECWHPHSSSTSTLLSGVEIPETPSSV